MTRLLAAILAFFLIAIPVRAADAASVTGLEYTAPAAPPDPTGLVFRLIALTVAMLGLCLAIMWLARRNNRPAAFAGGGGRMQHEGSLTLGRGCALHVLRVDGQTVAVTTDTTGLRSIAILSEPFEAVLAESTDGPADLETETTRAA